MADRTCKCGGPALYFRLSRFAPGGMDLMCGNHARKADEAGLTIHPLPKPVPLPQEDTTP